MSRRITALQIQKKNPDRVSVFLDDEFAFGVYHLIAAPLKVGQLLDDEQIQGLKRAEAGEKAYHRALNFLSYRVRTEKEIRRNLAKHETPEPVIESVLARLRRSHLVDDLYFAQTWVENRSDFRPRGRRALRSELRQKGIAEALIDEALHNLDEQELARRAAEKNARKYRRLEWPEFRQKLLGFLARRGFNYDVAAPAIEQAWAKLQEEPFRINSKCCK